METILPILRYEDARAAIGWLCAAFGFEERFSVPESGEPVRHARLALGASVVALGSVRPGDGLASPRALGAATQALCLAVDDVDAHCERARAAGAEITSPPHETEFGVREYHALDLEGHPWTFGSPCARPASAP